MIAFLCLLVGFFIGALFGIRVCINGYEEQIQKTGLLTVRSQIYRVEKVEARSEK